MTKTTQKQLKLDRELQVVNIWIDYHAKKESSNLLFDGNHSATEVKKEKDGFFKYSVSIQVKNGFYLEFEYFTKFDNQNKII